VDRRIAPSVQVEAAIAAALLTGFEEPDRLTELGRLGARLVLQRALEDELAAFPGRARYERTETAAESRNGHRLRRIQTAEGELTIAMPQVRETLTRFVSATIPDTRAIVRTRPLEALVIRAYVRGLSDRDIESLPREAGLDHISKTAVSGICRELRDRYRAFRARSLADVRLLSLMLDAIYLPVRPDGPKEGVLVAWGFTVQGERVLLDVCLGQRERVEDWLDLGQGLLRRGLRCPLLVVSDGAPGLIRRSASCGPTPTASAARSIASGTSWPSCRSGRGSTTGSGPPTGPPSTEPRRRPRPRPRCGSSSASSAASTHRPPPVSPTTLRRSPSTSPIRSGSRGGCPRRTCWSGRWMKFGDGRRSSVASRARPRASPSPGRSWTSSSPVAAALT